MSEPTTTVKMRADGTLIEMMDDGSESPLATPPLRAMTEAEIEAAASADPDARPIALAEMQAARRVPHEGVTPGADVDAGEFRSMMILLANLYRHCEANAQAIQPNAAGRAHTVVPLPARIGWIASSRFADPRNDDEELIVSRRVVSATYVETYCWELLHL